MSWRSIATRRNIQIALCVAALAVIVGVPLWLMAREVRIARAQVWRSAYAEKRAFDRNSQLMTEHNWHRERLERALREARGSTPDGLREEIERLRDENRALRARLGRYEDPDGPPPGDRPPAGSLTRSESR